MVELDPVPEFVQALHNTATITETIYGLLWAVDAKQWNDFADLCTVGVEVQWPELVGELPGPRTVPALVDRLASRFGTVTTLHQCTNPIVTAREDRAEARVLVVARWRRSTLRGGDSCAVHGELQLDLVRPDGRWQVTAMRHARLWIEGNPGVLGSARTESAQPTRPRSILAAEAEPGSDAERLRRLEDRAAIHDLMMRFGQALDSKDWALYRSCLADRLILDFSETTGRPAREVDTDAFVQFASLRQRKHAAFHQYSNFQVRISGDTARCRLYLVARHRIPDSDDGDPLNVFVGWYDNEFVRTVDGWKVSVLRHPLQWVEGNALIKDAPDPASDELARRLFGQEAA